MTDKTKLSSRHEDKTQLSSRHDDKTRLSERGQRGPSLPVAQEDAPTLLATTIISEAASLSIDTEADELTVEVYQPRTFVDQPAEYASAQPFRQGQYQTAPAQRQGAEVAPASYKLSTNTVISLFVAAMGLAVVAAGFGIWFLAAGLP